MMKNLTLLLLLSLTTTFAISAQPLVTPGWVYNNELIALWAGFTPCCISLFPGDKQGNTVQA